MKKPSIADLRREYNAPGSRGGGLQPLALYRYWFRQVLRALSVAKHEYKTHGLTEKAAPALPYALFKDWFGEAVRDKLLDPNAMTLGTLGPGGRPALRTVLLKDFDGKGFVFYTNYHSQKGRELRHKPLACLLFYWPPLARQVRIDGRVAPVPSAESDEYFASRPRGSQLGAWASPQSREVPSREFLEKRMRFFEEKFKDKPVPRPPHWGGFRLTPERFEFWNGRPNRLHDRLVYRRKGKGVWTRTRLAP